MLRKFLLALALCAAVAGAGCVEPEATASLEPVTPSEVTEKATINAGILDDAVKEAAENGSSNTTTRDLPRDVTERDKPVLYNETVYNLSEERVGEVEVTEIEVTANTTQQEADLNYDQLSEKDKETIEGAIVEAGEENKVIISSSYTPEELVNSVFENSQTVNVAFEGEVYNVTVRDRDMDVREEYVYYAEEIGENKTAYGNSLIRDKAFTLREAPNGSSEVLNEAINGTYYGDETEGFNALRDRFEQEDAVYERNESAKWLVRYNGELYWAELEWDYE